MFNMKTSKKQQINQHNLWQKQANFQNLKEYETSKIPECCRK